MRANRSEQRRRDPKLGTCRDARLGRCGCGLVGVVAERLQRARDSVRSAVRELLQLLALVPPPHRRPSEKLGALTIRAMLEQALAALDEELPDSVSASIEPDDERSAAATLDHYAGDPGRGDSPTEGMPAVAAGIAWERAS